MNAVRCVNVFEQDWDIELVLKKMDLFYLNSSGNR